MNFALHSPEFQNGGAIPEQYARDGQNLSPPLRWRNPPAGTKSFLLIMEDPDAPHGTFRHWGVHGINPQQTELREGIGADGRHQAVNDFGRRRYDGPQPPRGDSAHHYHFKLCALDVANLDVPPDASVERTWNAAKTHVIGEAELVGLFQR
jgi:Raf kinase inhibitor-like YbhB/YbcL family protein